MEVGAVKQAFNNEVILLKKKLNQAKIQIIHKLTRKAKTLTEKKAPDHLKEKQKRKAESAVNEVLIIKKIKAKDIAKFIITHTGKVNDYLNKPKVDADKACARLVLHKALQDKYKFIRNRFGDIPIKDLFMSRQERLKLKKEEKEQQKNKKKAKNKTNQAGTFNIEDMDVGADKDDDVNANGDVDDRILGDETQNSIDENDDSGDESDKSDGEDCVKSGDEKDSDDGEENVVAADRECSDDEMKENKDSAVESDENDRYNSESENEEVGKFIKIKPETKVTSKEKLKPAINKVLKPEVPAIDIESLKTIPKLESSEIDKIITEIQIKKQVKKQTDKKVKENKNKNLKEKMDNRKFKKDEENYVEGKKIVDPFFITASGENYLSVAEPRAPDEVKEVHKQGNRQERRAAMFGRKYKPKNNFGQNNFRSNKFDNSYEDRKSGFGNRNDRFGNESNFDDRSSKFNDRNGRFDDRNDKFNNRNDKHGDRNSKFNEKNDRFSNKSFSNSRSEDKKEEKLHPSWEAKRKLKSMPLLPSQGKKIVFDE